MGYIGNAPYQGIVDSGNILDGSIQSGDIANSAITSAKINDSAITSSKLASGSVTSSAIASDVTTLINQGGGPKITAVQVTNSSWTVLDDTAVDTSGGYIKITGTNFASGCTVIAGTTVASAVTFTSSTELRVQFGSLAAGSYVLYVSNPDGGTAIRVNGITFSATPSWTTSSTLPNGDDGVAISIQLNATSATSYALQSGSTLPAGLTLSSAGLLSGTVSGLASDTTYNFTVVATDAELQDSPRAFSITISVGDPYWVNTTLMLTGDSGDNILRDSSTNNFAITAYGDSRASNFSPYLTGWSNYFDGSGDYLSLADNDQLNYGSNPFTLEVWVYCTSSSATQNFVSQFGSGIKGINFGINYNGTAANKIQFVYSKTGSDELPLTDPNTMVLNQWNHIAVARTGNTISLFVNGARVATTTETGAINNSSRATFTIGAYSGNSGEDGTTPFQGYLSGLRSVKGTAIYDATQTTLTVPTAPLTAVPGTSLLICNANRLVDQSANNFAITKNGDVRVDSFNPFNLTNTGTTGSMYFDGSGDYIVSASSSNLSPGTGDFTLECWVYFTAAGVDPGILQIGPSAPGTNTPGYTNSIGLLRGTTGGVGGKGSFFVNGSPVNGSSIVISLNSWYHLAVARQGTTHRYFVNGVLDGTATDTANYTGSYFFAGVAYGSNYPMTGYISDIRFIKGTAVYTANFTPPTSPITAVANTQLLTLQNRQPHNNHSFQDSSANNHLITRSGNTTQGTFSPFSQTGWGNYFDGSSYLSLSNGAALAAGTSNFTAEFWVYPTTDQQSQVYGTVFHVGSGTSGAFAISLLYSSAGAMKIRVGTLSIDYESTSTISTNRWYHIALVREGTSSNQTKIYVDGSLFYTFTFSDNLSNTSGLYVGSTGFNLSVRRLSGYVSNLRYTVGTALYTGAFTPSTSPLTTTSQGATASQVELLTCQNNRFLDNSSNAWTFTTSGSPSVQAFSPFRPGVVYSPATHGGSAYFDGSVDYLTLPSFAHNGLKTNNFTWECWVYRNSVTDTTYADAICCQLSNYGTNAGFAVGINPGGQVGYAIGSGGTWTIRLGVDPGYPMGSIIVPLRTWTHIALVRNGSTFVGFVNGVVDQSFTSSSSIDEITSTYAIGRWHDANTRYWNGYISNMRLILGESLYSTTNTTNGTQIFTPSTTPFIATANTKFLMNFSSPAILDSTAKNLIETVGDVKSTSVQSKWSGGRSMFFDGTGDYLKTTNNYLTGIGTGDFTVEGWWNFSDFTTRNVYFQRFWSFGTGLANDVTLNVGNDGTVVYRDNDTQLITSSITLSINTWNHIALVRYNGTTTLYINGVNRGTTSTNNNLSTRATNPLYIGSESDGAGGYFIGYVQDFRVTRYARYTANFTPPTSPPKLK